MSSNSTRRVAAWVLAAALGLAIAPAARAITILVTFNGPLTLFLVVCDGGPMVGPFGSIPEAQQVGGALCEPFGGIADITEVEVLDALSGPAEPASTWTPGQDQGDGTFRPLGPDDFEEVIADTGGEPRVLPGIRALSVVVRGVELASNTQRGPAPLPLLEIYADSDGDGEFVGGLTGPATPVPATGRSAWLLGIALALAGSWLVLRRLG